MKNYVIFHFFSLKNLIKFNTLFTEFSMILCKLFSGNLITFFIRIYFFINILDSMPKLYIALIFNFPFQKQYTSLTSLGECS